MRALAATLLAWCEAGVPFAVAEVVDVAGSAPLPPGACLAVNARGEAAGGVSGGCVEAAVYELCREVLATGAPVLERFDADPSDPFATALTCGGVIEVFVQAVAADGAVPTAYPAVRAALAAMARGAGPVALARVISGPPELLGASLTIRPDGPGADGVAEPATLGPVATGPMAVGLSVVGLSAVGPSATWLSAAARRARGMLAAGATGVIEAGTAGEGDACGEPVRIFVESSVPPPRMLVFGAVDHAAALVRVGRLLGYRVTLCDARPIFATRERFPDADEVVVAWPHAYLADTQVDGRTVICVLTHDPKFDVPALTVALRLPVAFVGAMGSRRTCADRADRLRAAGVTERELARLRAPIGLDLGGITPEETAVSIAAEIIAVLRGGGGAPLSATTGAIHRTETRHRPSAGPAVHYSRAL